MIKKITRTKEENKLRNYILEKGYRETPERYKILKRVINEPKPFMINSFCDRNEDLNRSSVYNTMNILLSSGIVKRKLVEESRLKNK